MRLGLALAIVSLVSVAAVPAGGMANEAPLADAGLDQTVEKYDTVYLDASGSRDPDGRIVSYEWTITDPNGTRVRPVNRGAGRAEFVPDTVGTYEVTVTVTDDDGATASDTLLVRVAPGAPPTVSLSGPSAVSVGDTASFTMNADAGSATLDHLSWYVDGTPVDTAPLGGGHARKTLERPFSVAGSHTVTAVVEDVDGQTASASHTVQATTENSGSAAPGDASGPPVLHGDRLLTGRAPFADTYRVTADGGLAGVQDVTWWKDGTRAGSGTRTRISWTPGDHRLYAVVEYHDGTSRIARFPDDSTSVTVDPQPRVQVAQLNARGRIGGRTRATDPYGNIKRLSVSINGTTVASREVSPIEARDDDTGNRLATSFDRQNVTAGDQYQIQIRAEDYRGQVTTVTRVVTAKGLPEVVSAEFVNDPVDSYHPRLDPDRYVAHHVLKIDLNGVDPQSISISAKGLTEHIINTQKPGYESKKLVSNGHLYYHSYWAGEYPKNYRITHHIYFTKHNIRKKYIKSSFNVSQSPPEMRLNVITDGTNSEPNNWGMTVDASESFDPDGTELSFLWQQGAIPITDDNKTAKFDSLDRAGLVIKDGGGLTTSRWFDFNAYFNPGIAEVEEMSEGPYKPNETVRFRVRTHLYKLTKDTYHISLGIRDSADVATIREWEKLNTGSTPDIETRDHNYYEGIVEVKARNLRRSASGPELEVFNEESPERTGTRVPLPDVVVLEKGDTRVTNVSIQEISYLVKQPRYSKKTTQYQWELQDLLADGYHVRRTNLGGTKYTIERREKVQSAKFETETKSFSRRGYRSVFLEAHPEWEASGSATVTRQWNTTEQEWRDSKSGKGTFTGETREVQVTPPEYRVLRQYRYEYEKTKTDTRTVTRTRTISVPETRHRTVVKCNAYIGCYRSTETYTVMDTRTVSYEVREEYSYTVTETDTYWAQGKRQYDHEWTGAVRREKIKAAQYKQQYLYEYQERHSETIERYQAKHHYQIQPARYRWSTYRTVRSQVAARSLASDENKRIADRTPAKKWILVKQTGVDYARKDDYQNPSHVLSSRVEATAEVVQYYQPSANNGDEFEERSTKTKAFVFEGLVAGEVSSRIKSKWNKTSNRGQV